MQLPQEHDQLPVEQPREGKQKPQGKAAQRTCLKVEDKRRISPSAQYQLRQQDLQQNPEALDQDPKQEEHLLQKERACHLSPLHRKARPAARAA